MAVISLKRMEEKLEGCCGERCKSVSWTDIAAGGALVVGGFLLLTGRRKAGTVVAASGAALALMEQQEILRKYWEQLPTYVDNVQHVVGQVQDAMTELEARRVQLHTMLQR
jgi:hypothetical protein